ncbi:hypothetical protein EVJ58_g524 [Rhodofomes roseus]|uniref:Uncharacterized protein n=1 Tax=Rhodofomes roseus TaxID=34475 RepID=A0A4Y9Z637_9APHY|nr:hypothetical protein EVJ58_g524 [Rhodofomes roseus]
MLSRNIRIRYPCAICFLPSQSFKAPEDIQYRDYSPHQVDPTWVAAPTVSSNAEGFDFFDSST